MTNADCQTSPNLVPIERRTNGTFAPGVSGNPRGRPRAWDEMTALCREHTPLAIATLAEIVGDRKPPAASRVTAAVALLDRGYGRPPVLLGVQQAKDPFEGMSTEELKEMLDTIRAVRSMGKQLEALSTSNTAEQ